MSTDYLSYLARINSSGLHAHRNKGTDALVSLISLRPEDSILELGCGTCATLVRMASTFPECTFIGADINSAMLESGKHRIRFCNAGHNIKLDLLTSCVPLPYDDNSFDCVYAESVLAIQRGENLSLLLKDVHRIIKPGGILIFNESLWNNNISSQQISEYNKLCQDYFGIIQSNEEYPYLSDWIGLVNSCGFEVLSVAQSDSQASDVPKMPFRTIFLSSLFNYAGRLKLRLKTDLKKQKRIFDTHITVMAGKFNGAPVSGVIVKLAAQKNKPISPFT